MSKNKIKFDIKRPLIAYRLSKNENVNARDFDILERDEIGAFFPLQLEGKRKKQLICRFDGYAHFDDFIEYPFNIGMFASVVYQIINLITVAKEKAMNIKNIDFNDMSVFISTADMRLRFIYWPVVNMTIGVDLQSFLKNLVYKITFINNGDTQYVYRYIEYFETNLVFSMPSFEKHIASIFRGGPQRPGNLDGLGGAAPGAQKGDGAADGKANNRIYVPEY